ncbi:MAG TPA: mechanosensitive ion channel family protein [Terriglobales bacterium]|nr:mechanosensitive ion channel family protein [Terriglobales bacterium]
MRLESGRSARQLAFCRGQPTSMSWLHYPVAIVGTISVIVLALIAHFVARSYINRHTRDPKEHYRKRQFFNTLLTLAAIVTLAILWARPMRHGGTFLGLIGAGIAVALRDPLLSVAGRIAIFAGHMYTVGDRIQLKDMSGDVIDVGFFYTRMMEIGNWIGGDQVSGRIVQIPNSQVFGTAIFNYTQNFNYIWDEVMLPITFSSNLEEASKILTSVGGQYTKEFLKGAQEQMERMRQYFLVPEFELKPNIYVVVTSNWLQLTMRYVVEPKQRRSASSFIYTEVFKRVQEREDIQIASETMDLTIQQKNTQQKKIA